MIFTNALDEYLEAKKARDDAKSGFDGYGFSDHFYKEVQRLFDAEDVLNKFFEKKEQA